MDEGFSMDIKIILGAIIGVFLVLVFGSAIMPSIETARGQFIDSNCEKTYVNTTYDGGYVKAPCILKSDGSCKWSQNESKTVTTCTNAIQQTASDKVFSRTTVFGLITIMLIIGIIGMLLHYKFKGHN
jgi:hypothetical protein